MTRHTHLETDHATGKCVGVCDNCRGRSLSGSMAQAEAWRRAHERNGC